MGRCGSPTRLRKRNPRTEQRRLNIHPCRNCLRVSASSTCGYVHGLMTDLNDVWGGMGRAFKTPAEVRKSLPKGKPVVAFQNRNPAHKAHFELLLNAKEDVKDSIIFV